MAAVDLAVNFLMRLSALPPCQGDNIAFQSTYFVTLLQLSLSFSVFVRLILFFSNRCWQVSKEGDRGVNGPQTRRNTFNFLKSDNDIKRLLFSILLLPPHTRVFVSV